MVGGICSVVVVASVVAAVAAVVVVVLAVVACGIHCKHLVCFNRCMWFLTCFNYICK